MDGDKDLRGGNWKIEGGTVLVKGGEVIDVHDAVVTPLPQEEEDNHIPLKFRGWGVGICYSGDDDDFIFRALWRSALCFGADYVFTVGRRIKRTIIDALSPNSSLPIFHLSDIRELYTHAVLIVIESSNLCPTLADFKHPLEAAYLLKTEKYGLPEYKNKNGYCSVIGVPGSYYLDASVLGSIVMYDRYVKKTRS